MRHEILVRVGRRRPWSNDHQISTLSEVDVRDAKVADVTGRRADTRSVIEVPIGKSHENIKRSRALRRRFNHCSPTHAGLLRFGPKGARSNDYSWLGVLFSMPLDCDDADDVREAGSNFKINIFLRCHRHCCVVD